MICKFCNHEYTESKYPNFCSWHCKSQYKMYNSEPNSVCCVCGKHFYLKPYRINRASHGVCCSLECSSKYRSLWFSCQGNHQYGLLGNLNATFKYDEKTTNYGYIVVSAPHHPFRNSGNRVFKHRLVIEENADKFDDKYFIEIDGKKYLKKEYHIHHINENKKDNRLENLQIMTMGEHRSLHNKLRPRQRDKKGRFI